MSSLPSFISVDEAPFVYWSTQDSSDSGTYWVRLYGAIYRDGLRLDRASTDFQLTVYGAAVEPYYPEIEADWDLTLQDKIIFVGEEMDYPILQAWNNWTEVNIDLGSAKGFLHWDPVFMTFSVK